MQILFWKENIVDNINDNDRIDIINGIDNINGNDRIDSENMIDTITNNNTIINNLNNNTNINSNNHLNINNSNLYSNIKNNIYKHKCIDKIHEIISSKACRSSIMVGDTLSKSQMEKIVFNLGCIERPWKCPHGRPTFMVIEQILYQESCINVYIDVVL